MRNWILAVAVGCVLAASGCSSSGSSDPGCDAACTSDLQSAYIAGSKYTYSVTGDAVDSSVITYTSADNAIQQAANAPLPWSLTVDGYANDYILSAQNDVGGTTITCSIADGNGTIVDTHTATGQYAIVQCQTPG